jgi:cell wall-associated NlpC family hydrolase
METPDPLQRIVEHYPTAYVCTVVQAFADFWDTPDQMRLGTKLVWGTQMMLLETVMRRNGNYALALLPNGRYGVPATTTNLPFSLGFVAADALAPAVVPDFDGETACELAHRFIGTPYLWGGGTPFGFDCSGFVQRIYSVLGVTIPRDAYLQAQSPLGTFRESGKVRKAGDLVFFGGQSDPRGRGITHVGMALDNRHFIHACGKTGVTLSAFDDPDIAKSSFTKRSNP